MSIFNISTELLNNTLMDNSTEDSWDIGTLYKPGIWSFYVVTNYIGAILCIGLSYLITTLKHKSPIDIYVMCLCSGCILMSIPCATQCLLNLSNGNERFEYGKLACELEAFFHVSAIIVQFVSILMIALSSCLSILYQVKLSKCFVYSSCIIIWLFAELGTYFVGTASHIYLMPAGAYCFYQFASPAIAYWFSPIMVISLIFIIVSYSCIFCRLKESMEKLHTNVKNWNDSISTNYSKKTIIFVIVFFVGWFPAVITCIYELSVGNIFQVLDTLVGICGSLHSIMVPLAYSYQNKRIKETLECFNCEKKEMKYIETSKENSIEITKIPSTIIVVKSPRSTVSLT